MALSRAGRGRESIGITFFLFLFFLYVAFCRSETRKGGGVVYKISNRLKLGSVMMIERAFDNDDDDDDDL